MAQGARGLFLPRLGCAMPLGGAHMRTEARNPHALVANVLVRRPTPPYAATCRPSQTRPPNRLWSIFFRVQDDASTCTLPDLSCGTRPAYLHAYPSKYTLALNTKVRPATLFGPLRTSFGAKKEALANSSHYPREPTFLPQAAAAHHQDYEQVCTSAVTDNHSVGFALGKILRHYPDMVHMPCSMLYWIRPLPNITRSHVQTRQTHCPEMSR
ncbi:hypothetical protein COCC4DRAFT_76976 [Bipolaris maydis ATCC 48331]|uniref:Uncharacterized protein n=2 Tax=Cochliobolus heterostrophus TaxID=5016 RepID=M2UDM1_COCH5|nr:uncharacterized protein COCC4DRAFT_76976 [Bipolaris maydis ATCC 48331]EMD96654.1 hypothetical protein COCHEDRAFT_1199551 [Bipolaris maydis C5]ENH98780.1 hypothetical protein COCC4DRAFT_76976 [Bipolaris maydis ATCC 48331]KAJ5031463.1 hypothetical protein J3E73DRAFT_223571 [Bipolaris maydis]KAJ6211302.1 hypothetical protein PSV09DRAFT_1199551 [Bipolaris maydis]